MGDLVAHVGVRIEWSFLLVTTEQYKIQQKETKELCTSWSCVKKACEVGGVHKKFLTTEIPL
jgi:hypothetical protein